MKKLRIVAFVSALIAGLAIYQFLKEISKPVEIPRTAVVVAAVNIPENTEITPEMVMLTPIANESLLPGCTNMISDVVGMIMKSDVYPGEQITSNRLIKLGEESDSNTSLSYLIEPGKRAISIAVGSLTSVTNMIKPGNHVDVILNYNYEQQKKGKPAGEMEVIEADKYLLENIVVLAVAQNTNKDGQSEYSSVTLQLSPEETLLLNYAEMHYSLRLVLRSPLDAEPNGCGEIGLDDLKEANRD